MTTLKYKNYFELLDVTENSTDMEIKKAYFTKIRQYSNEKFPEEFQILTKAYQTLSNPEEKEAYIKSLKVGGNPDELLREVHHHMSEDNFFKAKELLKKLFDNGYNDDIAVISDYLECSMETGDLTLTKKLVAILESDFSSTPEAWNILKYYYFKTENYHKCFLFAQKTFDYDPSNDMFLELFNIEYFNINKDNAMNNFKKYISEIPIDMTNLSIYQEALFRGIENNNHRLVQLAEEKLIALASVSNRLDVIYNLIDTVADHLDSNKYAFDFMIRLIDRLNTENNQEVNDWVNRRYDLIDPELIYYSQENYVTTREELKYEDNDYNVPVQSTSIQENDRGPLWFAIILGLFVGIGSGKFIVGIIAGAIWYFFGGLIMSLIGCLVLIIIVVSIIGLIFGW